MSRVDAGFLAAVAVAALALLAPAVGTAAPPSPNSQYFNAPYRKTLEEYDRGTNKAGVGRDAFQRGLKALDDGEFNAASTDFADSSNYETAFNEALSEQLAHRYGRAEALYGKARGPDRRDPELETNLAMVLAAEGKVDASMQRFDAALALAPDADVRGRILYQRSLAGLGLGQMFDAFDLLSTADAAFEAAGDAHGRAVVAATRGEMLLATRSGEAESLLLDAVAQLQSVGALVDESDARLTLARYYLRTDSLQKAGTQLDRAVASAEAAGNSEQLGRSLIELGQISSPPGAARGGDRGLRTGDRNLPKGSGSLRRRRGE